jgi:hypothetical protein
MDFAPDVLNACLGVIFGAFLAGWGELTVQVARWPGWRHDYRMGRDRIEPGIPDLFSTDMVRDASAPATRLVSAMEAATDTASKRYVLPKDLPNALKYLTDRELDLLITASVEEAKRRGRLLVAIQTATPNGFVPKRLSSRVKRQAETAWLSPGQINAVRAAFKAGVTPSRIARQFGISQSDVRRVLASKTVTQEGR